MKPEILKTDIATLRYDKKGQIIQSASFFNNHKDFPLSIAVQRLCEKYSSKLQNTKFTEMKMWIQGHNDVLVSITGPELYFNKTINLTEALPYCKS